MEFVYNAFLKLDSCRSTGFGVSRIPWTAVSQFCHDYHIKNEDQEDFEELIGKMDQAYIKHFTDKAEAERNKTPPRKVTKRR